jgi:hypothetical protein
MQSSGWAKPKPARINGPSVCAYVRPIGELGSEPRLHSPGRFTDQDVPAENKAIPFGLFDFRRRRRCRKCALECCKICAGQVRNRDVGEIPIAPASDVISGDRLFRNGLAGRQGRQADCMRGVLVDDRGNGIMADDIHPTAQQREALLSEVGHLG